MNCSLHIQVVGVTADEMIEEALRLVKEADSKIYIKVPVTKEGLKAIQILSSRGTVLLQHLFILKFRPTWQLMQEQAM